MSNIEEAEIILVKAITPLDGFSQFLYDHPIGDTPLCAASFGDLLRPYVEALNDAREKAFELLREEWGESGGLTVRDPYEI